MIKFGGAAIDNPARLHLLIDNVRSLLKAQIRCVIVHGGGIEIDRWLDKLGMTKKVVNGLRVTDENTMEVVEMVLSGKFNKKLASAFNLSGIAAVGLSGRDGKLLIAKTISDELGLVGEVTQVFPQIIETLLNAGFLPVVATVGEDEFGKPLNVNADLAASAIAVALKASKLLLMTDANGVLVHRKVPDQNYPRLSIKKARDLITSGDADRGMIPKLEACIEAVVGGVDACHILNASTENGLIRALDGEVGVGTVITET